MANTEKLKGPHWHFVKEIKGGIGTDSLLFRSLTHIEVGQLQAMTDDLNLRTDVKNEEGVASFSVDDPVIGDKTYEGRWRHVRTEGHGRGQDGRSGLIVQVLAKGFVKSAESLPTPELVRQEDSLLLPHSPDSTSSAKQIEVRYRSIDPAYVQTLQETIALTSGVIKVESIKMEDGSFNIHVLTETVSWLTFDVTAPDLTFYHNKDTQEERKIEVWSGVGIGEDVSALYTPDATYNVVTVDLSDNGNGGMNIRRVQYLEGTWTEDQREVINTHGLYSGSMVRLITVKDHYLSEPTEDAAVAGTVASFTSELDRGTGLWASRQINETVTWSNSTPTYNQMQTTGKGAYGEEQQHIAMGVDVSGAQAIVDAITGADDHADTTDYTVGDYVAIPEEYTTWASTLNIVFGDKMVDSGTYYICIETHDAGASFAANSDKFVEIPTASRRRSIYRCITAHTSGTDTFAQDLMRGRWRHVQDVGFQERGQGEAVVSKVEMLGSILFIESGYQFQDDGHTPEKQEGTWYGVPPELRADIVAAAKVWTGGGKTHWYPFTVNTSVDRKGTATVRAVSKYGSTAIPVPGGSSHISWNDRTNLTIGDWETKVVDGVMYKSALTITYDIIYKSNESAAWAEISGGDKGSTVSKAAGGRWRARKVTNITWSGVWGEV